MMEHIHQKHPKTPLDACLAFWGRCAMRGAEGHVHNALCHGRRGVCAMRYIGLCATPCVAQGGGGHKHFFAKRAGTLASLAVAQWLGQQTSDP